MTRTRLILARSAACLVWLAWLLVAGAALSEPSSHSDTDNAIGLKRPGLTLAIERFTLDNGLRVVLNPDDTLPAVSVAVVYDVGSRNEQLGRSGFAHLFEHMMFQGSRNVEKGEHFKLIAARGGKANGTTNKDRTNYFQTLPPNELELALWLEADRMGSLAVNQANFENQRAVVTEEYRMRYSSRAYALGYHRLHQLVFQGYWPYEHPTIGFLEDLDTARFSWLKRFHEAYYVPNNAVLAISGAFEPEEAERLVNKHFASLRPNPNLPRFDPPLQATQTSERLSVIVDANAKTPAAYYGFRIPPANTREHRALELVTRVLTGGESSRLHQSLVIEKAAAQSVASWTSFHRGPDALTIRLIVSPMSSIDKAQHWLDGELKRIRSIGPSAGELRKARVGIQASILRLLETSRGRATALGRFETFWQDATLLNGELTAYDDITPSEVRQVAAKYLLDTRRSIVEVYPPGWVRDIGPTVVTRTHVVKKGENLIRIARRYATTAEKLAKQNGIKVGGTIVVGQRLLVTAGSGYRAPRKHTVKGGETLIGIAKRYKITAKELAAANKISTKKPIHPGQQLTVPYPSKKSAKKTKDASPKSSKKRSARKTVTKTHTVKKGETLSHIAAKYGVPVAAVAKENGLSQKKNIFPGQKVRVTVPLKPKSPKKGSAAKGSKKK